MRGKGDCYHLICEMTGITPAYAGKRMARMKHWTVEPDHPRVCGEKTPDASSTTKSIGSPPRVRGKDGPQMGTYHPHGITPACAGKSLSVPTHGSRPGDHPRVCGEKGLDGAPAGSGLGSPPRVRGKEVGLGVRTPRIGITPAYAGKRWYTECAKRLPPDHPRVCGEKSGPCFAPPPSPGITPAYAGKSAAHPA